MKNTIKILLISLFLSGCAGGLVCRHTALSHVAWAEEQNLQYEIVVYGVSPILSFGIYDAHVQVLTEKGWVADFFGYPVISKNRTYPMTGWEGKYDIGKYMDLMRRGCLNGNNCKSEGIPY